MPVEIPVCLSASNKGMGKPSFWATTFRAGGGWCSMKIFVCTCSLLCTPTFLPAPSSTCATKICLNSFQPIRLHNQLNRKLFVSQNSTEAAFVGKVMFQYLILWNTSISPFLSPFQFTWQIMLLFRPSKSVKSIAWLHDEDLNWFKKKDKVIILAYCITEDAGRCSQQRRGMHIGTDANEQWEDRGNLEIYKHLWWSRIHY